MRKILAITACFLAISCTTATKAAPNQNLSLAYAYYSQGLNRLEGHDEYGLSLIFPSIPGEIFGNPSRDIIYSVSPKNGNEFPLILPADVENNASKLKEKSLTIKPSDTKIMRLGTFNYLPKYKNRMGGGGFKNIVNDNFIVLVYFSKAANITGKLLFGAESYTHNIAVDKAGWHWIEVSEDKPNSFELTTYKGKLSDIELSIFLRDATDT